MAGRIGCFSMDLSLGIWESSETFDAIFGIDPDYPRDTGGWLGLLAPDAREAHRRQLLALSQDQERFDLAFRIVRRSDGQERWISGQGALECDVQGQATRLIGTMQDLTEHRQAEQDLQISEQRSRAAEARIRRMNEELEQRVAERTAQLETANQELEAFSYSVSHDLCAPLQVISGSSETLLAGAQDRLDPVGRQCLAMISRSTWRMGQLINDLLKLAQAGRAGLELADLDLSGLCRNILAESGQAGPELELVIEADLRVRADLSLLRAALENLLANAVKFSSRQAAPRIAVELPAPPPASAATLSGTTGRALTWTGPASCSARSSASIPARNSRAPASAWRSSSGSSTAMAAGSGRRPPRTRAPPSSSPCPRPARPWPARSRRRPPLRRRVRAGPGSTCPAWSGPSWTPCSSCCPTGSSART